MYCTDAELSTLQKIFVSQRLPAPAARLIAVTLARWERNYGMEWVVKRLKSLRSALLSDDTTGIRTHKDGSFYGSFRPVYRLAKSSRRGAIRADRILRVYGRWEAAKPTQLDFQHFSESVRFAEYTYNGPDFPVSESDTRLGRMVQARARFDLQLPQSQSKIVPFLKRKECEVLPEQHYEALMEFCPTLVTHYRQFIRTNVYEYDEWSEDSYSLMGEIPEGNDPRIRRVGVVGKIACLTKDRGLKKRFIANPHRFLQLATSRLQDACASYLEALPESFVYDQDQSVGWVQSQLKAGKKMFSLDLSSATDHFPLAPQVNLLRKLFPALAADIALWEDICRSEWLAPDGVTSITYGKGQPMGTAPSFAAFTLSHIHFARMCGGDDSNFRVIGDDIVISCPHVALRYMEEMKRIGVEISLSKSLLDDFKAEFAGRIIDEHGLWPCYKASPLNLSKDPLGFVRQYGLAGLSLIPRKVRPMVGFVARLPLVGPAHCTDFRALDEIKDVDIDQVYGIKAEPYPTYRQDPSWSIWRTPVSRFEAAQQHVAGFLGDRGVNNDPRLVEHVNSNLLDGQHSVLLDSLMSMLQKGVSLPFWDEDERVKHPISYVKRLSRLRNSQTETLATTSV